MTCDGSFVCILGCREVELFDSCAGLAISSSWQRPMCWDGSAHALVDERLKARSCNVFGMQAEGCSSSGTLRSVKEDKDISIREAELRVLMVFQHLVRTTGWGLNFT
jgi:hypothetical protein